MDLGPLLDNGGEALTHTHENIQTNNYNLHEVS